jgi:hypothetical protein
MERARNYLPRVLRVQ